MTLKANIVNTKRCFWVCQDKALYEIRVNNPKENWRASYPVCEPHAEIFLDSIPEERHDSVEIIILDT